MPEAKGASALPSRNFGGQSIKVNEVRLGKLAVGGVMLCFSYHRKTFSIVEQRRSFREATFPPEKPRPGQQVV